MARFAVSVVLGLSLVAGSLAVVPGASADGPETMIELSVAPQAGGAPRTATLTCDPAGGTHPDAATACAELAKVNGDVKAVPWRQGWFCSALWLPVRATATGYWQGRPVTYSETISNDGCARIAHGHVLEF